jgi:hypothetical protein
MVASPDPESRSGKGSRRPASPPGDRLHTVLQLVRRRGVLTGVSDGNVQAAVVRLRYK